MHGRYFNSWEALGLGSIASYVRAQLRGVKISFFQGCFDSDDKIIQGSAVADVVAFSCTTPTFLRSVKIAREIKKINPRIKTVFGGYHTSSLPQESLIEGVDCVVVGEGESALVDIIRGSQKRILYGQPLDFSLLPWPDRKIIKNERNIRVAKSENGMRIASFQGHRGCPFACKYCLDGSSKVLYAHAKNHFIRQRPVSDLLDEIEKVVTDYRLDLIKFTDPTWNINLRWVEAFCEEKIRRKFFIPFYPNIHAGICSADMFLKMRQAGCYQAAIGIESGSPKILKEIGKGTTLSSIRRCVELAKKAGIRLRGYFILGMPDESNEDVILTGEFANELKLDEYGFSILCPYPGTQMYDPIKMNEVDWERADEYKNDFWKTKYLTNEQLRQWQDVLAGKFADKLTWHNKKVLLKKT